METMMGAFATTRMMIRMRKLCVEITNRIIDTQNQTWVFCSDASASLPNRSHLWSRVVWNAYMCSMSQFLIKERVTRLAYNALSINSGLKGDDARESATRPSTML